MSSQRAAKANARSLEALGARRDKGDALDGVRPRPSLSGMRTRVRVGARLHVRVVLRSARGRVRLRRDRPCDEPREDRGRTDVVVALRRPPSGRGRRRCRPRYRLHAAREGRPPRGRARPRRGVGEERHTQPDQLVQGPRRLGRAEQGARVRLQGRSVRVDREPRELGCGARGASGLAQLRVHPVESRAGQDHHDRGLRRQSRRDQRQLRRRQPPVRRAGRCLRVGVRQREHAAVLRRGQQDARVRDGGATRLAGARPCRRPGRERLVAHEDPQGIRGAAPGRAARRRAPSARLGRAGARVLAGRQGVHRGIRHDPAGQARHDREVARDREPGRRLFRARRRAHDRRRFRGGHRRRDRRRHASPRAHRGHLRRNGGRGDDRDVEEARRRRRHPARRAGRRVHHRVTA